MPIVINVGLSESSNLLMVVVSARGSKLTIWSLSDILPSISVSSSGSTIGEEGALSLNFKGRVLSY